MSKKNIKQNHLLQIKKVLNQVDKAGDKADHFRAIILIGDKNEQQAFSYLHAPQKDMENLILNAIRNSDVFAYSVAKAMETYCNEQDEQKSNETKTDTQE